MQQALVLDFIQGLQFIDHMEVGRYRRLQRVQVALVAQVEILFCDPDLAVTFHEFPVAVTGEFQLVPVSLVARPVTLRLGFPGRRVDSGVGKPATNLVGLRRHPVEFVHLCVDGVPGSAAGNADLRYARVGADAVLIPEHLEQAIPVLTRDHPLQSPDLLQVVIVLLQGLTELPVESSQLFAVEVYLLQLGLKIAQLLLVSDYLPGNDAGIDRRNTGAMNRADKKTAEHRYQPVHQISASRLPASAATVFLMPASKP